MDDLPPWEDDPEMTEVCPYCFLKHEVGRCLVQQRASQQLADLVEEPERDGRMSPDEFERELKKVRATWAALTAGR